MCPRCGKAILEMNREEVICHWCGYYAEEGYPRRAGAEQESFETMLKQEASERIRRWKTAKERKKKEKTKYNRDYYKANRATILLKRKKQISANVD
jgi:uncharacterized Zn finger protein (UPF0148 family)